MGTRLPFASAEVVRMGALTLGRPGRGERDRGGLPPVGRDVGRGERTGAWSRAPGVAGSGNGGTGVGCGQVLLGPRRVKLYVLNRDRRDRALPPFPDALSGRVER